MDDLVGERARAGDEADRARDADLARDDAEVGLPRRDEAGAVRTDQCDAAGATDLGPDPGGVIRGDALGDANDEAHTGVGGLQDGVGSSPSGDEDDGGVRTGRRRCLADGVEHPNAVDVGASPAGGDASDHLRPVGTVAQSVEAALTAGVAVSGLLLVAGLVLGSTAPLWWGVLLLILTPVVRVLVVTVGLILDHDWLFAGVSLFVLGVLLSSVYVSGRL